MEQCPKFDDISRFVDSKLDYQSDEYKHISECPKCKKLVKACRQADYAARHHLQDFAKDYDVEQMVKRVRAALEKEANKDRKLSPMFMKIAAGILIAAVPLALGYRYLYNEIPINAIDEQNAIALLSSDMCVAPIAETSDFQNDADLGSGNLEPPILHTPQAASGVAQCSLSIEEVNVSCATRSTLSVKEEIAPSLSKMKVATQTQKTVLPTKSVPKRSVTEKAQTYATPKIQVASIKSNGNDVKVEKAEKKSVKLVQKVDSLLTSVDTRMKKDSIKSSR